MLTQQRLKEVLAYDQETGMFTWLKSGGRRKVGDQAGCINNLGYLIIRYDKKIYLGHRLAWLYVNGKFPENNIDHINRIRSDNRICNLRDATQKQNCENQLPRAGSKSGVSGVNWDSERSRWAARIDHNNKVIKLGRFQNLEDAIAVRKAAVAKYFTHAHT